ncbi:hypothetical protein V8E51_006957 [Hyaloscypha variabilis]
MTASYHSHAPWRKAILIPFWTLQLGFELLMIAVVALAAGYLSTYVDGSDYDQVVDDNGEIYDVDNNTLNVAEHRIVPIWLGILCVCLILTIAEVILFARLKLKPLHFLITNVIKSTIWLALFVLEIVSVVDIHQYHTASVPAIIIEGALLLCFWIPLIYAGIIYHRFRKEAKSYKPVSHPESNLPDQYQVPQSEYPFPPQYQPYAKPNMGENTSEIPGRPLSYNPGDEGFEPYREHRRSVSDDGRPMSVPIMHIPEHGEAFEMDSRGRSPQ